MSPRHLPYANGHIHLGHLVEYIQTDIWVRFQKLRGQRLRLHLCRRHARHGDHDPCPAGRAQRRGADRRHARAAHRATSPASTSSSTITAARTARRTASCAASSGPRCARPAWSASATLSSFTTRRPARFWPIGSSKEPAQVATSPDQYGDSCEKCGSTYSPTDLIDPVSTLSGATPEIRTRQASVRQHRAIARLSRRVDAKRRAPAARSGQLSARGIFSASRCAIGTSRARRRILASRFPTARAIIGTSGSTRRSATWPRPSEWCDANGENVRRLGGASARDRSPSFHRQGHHVFSHAVLAGDAQDGRLQPADARSTSTAF